MNKRFTFTEDSPLRTLLLDDEDRPVYKIDTPIKLFRSTTKISRYTGSQDDEEIARIHWHYIHNSQIIIGGRILEAGKFLKRAGFVRKDHKFTGPDGQEYKWDGGFRSTKLTLNDGSETLVACFTPSSRGLVTVKRRACLEIYPVGLSMVDLIITTFVYSEEKNRESDRS
ncbi:hypothetical protein JAAARDRAFT_42686 [Jaapia argillacea MUCL 33604]|uniref:DUF6593 domain-containing protein n=1 Tax=Jaapia argillacea MUCL 33604 TaxID=933084 RepID=A0A067P770_9AGAM|nr:hypothetical protein JAAARDRAFT_42686 [Jaapia argillacea MUCL 33604]